MNRFLFIAALLFTVIPGTMHLHAMDLPEEAFALLAEAAADPCSICAWNKTKKAFEILNRSLVPGAQILTGGRCRIVKTAAGNNNELSLSCYPSDTLTASLAEQEKPPDVVFAFYTPQERLVGISEADYTDRSVAQIFHDSKPGSAYDGKIILIPYAYGDGPTYNYFQEAHRLMIHCKVLQLTPLISR